MRLRQCGTARFGFQVQIRISISCGSDQVTSSNGFATTANLQIGAHVIFYYQRFRFRLYHSIYSSMCKKQAQPNPSHLCVERLMTGMRRSWEERNKKESKGSIEKGHYSRMG